MNKKTKIAIVAALCFVITAILISCFILYCKNNNCKINKQTNIFQSLQNNDDTLNKINDFQKRYFEIIKRNDAFLNMQGNSDTKKDLQELKSLFDEIKNNIDKDINFYKQYENIVTNYRQNTGNTTLEMNQFASSKYKAIDKLLNNIYQELKIELSKEEFEKLKLSQRQWLKDVQDYNKVFEAKKFGTIATLVKLDYETNMCSFRSLLLMLYLKNDNSLKLSDYLGDWSEVYAGRIYLNIENNKDKIKVIYGGANSAYSHSETVYDCNYDENRKEIKCDSAVRTDQFESCRGFNTEDNLDEFLECSEKYPNEVKDDYKKYSDNKEKILVIKKGNENHFVADEDEDMPEDKKEEIKANYENMKIYFKDDKDLVFYKYKN